jgi:hypothetical protein
MIHWHVLLETKDGIIKKNGHMIMTDVENVQRFISKAKLKKYSQITIIADKFRKHRVQKRK